MNFFDASEANKHDFKLTQQRKHWKIPHLFFFIDN